MLDLAGHLTRGYSVQVPGKSHKADAPTILFRKAAEFVLLALGPRTTCLQQTHPLLVLCDLQTSMESRDCDVHMGTRVSNPFSLSTVYAGT